MLILHRKLCVCLYLYLLYGQVQEGVLTAYADQTLGPLTAHAGSQTAIQLDHDKFVEAGSDVGRETLWLDFLIGLDLPKTQQRQHTGYHSGLTAEQLQCDMTTTYENIQEGDRGKTNDLGIDCTKILPPSRAKNLSFLAFLFSFDTW